MTGSIALVPDILVGNYQRIEDATLGGGWATGTTVVLVTPLWLWTIEQKPEKAQSYYLLARKYYGGNSKKDIPEAAAQPE